MDEGYWFWVPIHKMNIGYAMFFLCKEYEIHDFKLKIQDDGFSLLGVPDSVSHEVQAYIKGFEERRLYDRSTNPS